MLVDLTAIFENGEGEEYEETICINVDRIDYIHVNDGRTVVELGNESLIVKESLEQTRNRIINAARDTHGV